MITANGLTGVSLVGEGAFARIEDTEIKLNATEPIDAPPGRVELVGRNAIEVSHAT